MAQWLIRKEANVRQYWRKLQRRPAQEQRAFQTAEAILAERPLPAGNPPGLIKHLKRDYHCNHEYRDLPNEQRIIYKVFTRAEVESLINQKQWGSNDKPEWESEDQPGIVILSYAGPHP